MPSNLVAAASGLGPLILDQRDETERGRRLPPKIVAELIDTKLCRMGLPAELAGLDAHPVEWLRALEVLAGFEASVPWIAWNNSVVCLFSRFLADSVRAELFADPGWLYAQSTRPSGRAVVEGDAYRVSGRWSLVSGCELAEWLFLTCEIEENGETRTTAEGEAETRFVFVARGDAEILDTWHVGGLRGTGSHDVIVDELLVPHERSVSPADGSKVDEPIGRMPIICKLGADFAAQSLGVAQKALDTVVDLAHARVTPGPIPDLRDRPRAQTDVALYAAALGGARSELHSSIETVWDRAVSGAEPSAVEIAAAHAASLFANDVALRTVDAMYAAGGTSVLYTNSPLERAHRDLHAMLRHIVAQPMWLEDAGRITFGLDPLSPLFLL